ncbi:hypothetical protein [Brachybacterium aquaticum]|uniref:Tissue inhibitor of metalloproteinase n=1 Tax=Brachybacterium aquaticum TaxID=1432564 RepID=A0A841AFU8_9MICO|nr:hypothetical protein [Brachybacterium aquaticum]MBB5832863.1 hypothetical protein [Brachybacterium aquaticum]
MDTTTARRGGTLLAVLVGLLLLALGGAPVAHACSCVGYDFDEAVEEADLIADVRVQHELEAEDGYVTYYAVVDRVWKGEHARTIRLGTHEQTTACGLGRIPPDSRLRLWAYGGDGSYSTNWCALPQKPPSDVRAALTEKLGEPTDLTDIPLPVEPERVPRPPSWPLYAVGVVLVARVSMQAVRAAAVGVGLALHRRSRG